MGTFSFGEIQNHVQDIFDKNQDVTGVIPGNCNLRDKPDARLKGGTIQQHAGSLLPAIFGLIDQESNVINAIDYCFQLKVCCFDFIFRNFTIDSMIFFENL